MPSRSVVTLLALAVLTILALPLHAQNVGKDQAPAGGNPKAGLPTTTIIGTIPDPRVRELPSPWVLSRPEGKVRLDFSKYQVTHRVIALDPARIKYKGAKSDEVILTVTGTLMSEAMAVRDLTLHLNPVQWKAHQATLARQRLDACRGNLRHLEAAKEQWALDGGKSVGSVPTSELLKDKKYLTRMPVCPEGGTYTLRAVGDNPTCSIKGHLLP